MLAVVGSPSVSDRRRAVCELAQLRLSLERDREDRTRLGLGTRIASPKAKRVPNRYCAAVLLAMLAEARGFTQSKQHLSWDVNWLCADQRRVYVYNNQRLGSEAKPSFGPHKKLP